MTRTKESKEDKEIKEAKEVQPDLKTYDVSYGDIRHGIITTHRVVAPNEDDAWSEFCKAEESAYKHPSAKPRKIEEITAEMKEKEGKEDPSRPGYSSGSHERAEPTKE